MLAELVDVLVWIVRGGLVAGLLWGAWLCLGPAPRSQATAREFAFERFAAFALLILLLTTVGGLLHAG